MYRFIGPVEKADMPEKTDKAKAESVLSDLLNCPFCGEIASYGTIKYASDSDIPLTNGGQELWHYCHCIRCGTSNMGIIGFKTKEAANEHWNKRAV